MTLMKNLYISDLDGTLLQDDATLSDYARKHLQEMLDAGLPFTVASARSVIFIKSLLAGLKFKLPIIEFNGAFISDLATGHHHFVNSINPELVEQIHQLTEEHEQKAFISAFDGERDRVYYNDMINDGMKWYLNDRQQARDERLSPIDDLADSFDKQIVCLTIIGRGHRLEALAEAIDHDFGKKVQLNYMENFYSPGWYWLTVHDQRATKAQAIRRLKKLYQLEDHQLVVFGDNLNDIPMFEIADRAYAVENCVEGMQKYATGFIGSNQDDAVVRFIEQDWTKTTD